MVGSAEFHSISSPQVCIKTEKNGRGFLLLLLPLFFSLDSFSLGLCVHHRFIFGRLASYANKLPNLICLSNPTPFHLERICGWLLLISSLLIWLPLSGAKTRQEYNKHLLSGIKCSYWARLWKKERITTIKPVVLLLLLPLLALHGSTIISSLSLFLLWLP